MRKAIYILLLIVATLSNKAKAQDSTLFPKGEVGANKDDYTGTI